MSQYTGLGGQWGGGPQVGGGYMCLEIYLYNVQCTCTYPYLPVSGLVPTCTWTLRNLTSGLSLRAGAPCDNFQGYCDVFLKCRQVGDICGLPLHPPPPQVDAEGPLVRLKNLLLDQDTLLTIAQWVTVGPVLSFSPNKRRFNFSL